MEFTPGPWEAHLVDDEWWVGQPNKNGLVAVCPMQPEHMANACLIAAAPELLAALWNLVGCFTTNMLDQNDNRKYWTAGLAALAKAEGR